MATIDAEILSSLLLQHAVLRPVEPHIYSVLPDRGAANEYDARFGCLYDRVACNPLSNRLIWGYPVGQLASFARDALHSSSEGAVLDLGCGSLAFTAGAYVRCSDRTVYTA